MTIQPIETRYAGCRFRSRLEARWAVFFDQLKIQWFYEPQGWLTLGAPYLPDFYLPHQNLWFEVKGRPSQIGDSGRRYESLALGTRRRVILAVGDIPRPDEDIATCEGVNANHYMEVFYPEGWDNYQAWCRCDMCGATDVQFMGWNGRNCKCHPSDRGCGAGERHPDLLAAYEAARSARFEHGERP